MKAYAFPRVVNAVVPDFQAGSHRAVS